MSDGILLVDKPQGLTSHDVVARLRRVCRTRRVGHAGTLDPMATGLLVVGVGRATRLLTHLVGADKTYAATVRLGQSTVTDDAEGTVTSRTGAPDHLDLEPALARLRGDISQVPSSVSAIKVGGERSYTRVRAGEEVRLDPRPVTVHRLDLTRTARGVAADGTPVLDLDIVVECSSGTYVRALARDLGESLGVGGHLIALRRTAVGPFRVEEARTLDALVAEPGPPVPMTMTEIASRCLPTLPLEAAAAAALRVGRPVPEAPGDGVYAALAPDGHLIGLVANRDGAARAVLVVDPA